MSHSSPLFHTALCCSPSFEDSFGFDSSSEVTITSEMHLFSALIAIGFAATVAAQGSAGGSQDSCSPAQNWVYKGCYDDARNGPHAGFTWKLSASTNDPQYYPGYIASNMTVNFCQRACRGHGFRWAGLYGGSECWCGPSFPLAINPDDTADGLSSPSGSAAGTQTSAAACSSTCNGNPAEFCGSRLATSLYYDPSFPDLTPKTESASNYAYVGCFSYVAPGSTYIQLRTTSTSACQSYCGLVGYPFSSRSSSDTHIGDTNCGCVCTFRSLSFCFWAVS